MKRWASALLAPLTTLLLAVLLVAATVAVTIAVVRPAPLIVATPDKVIRVAVIGDSYTSGLNNTVVWPSLLAFSTNLAFSNVAFPGAGYVGGVGESGPFADQVDRALASKPDVIVVFGGINDVGRSKDLVTQAASDLYTRLARGAPNAQMLVLGPIWYLQDLPQAFYDADDAIAEAAQRSKIPYTSLIRKDWLEDDGMIQSDQVHPTDAGQLVLERNLGPLLVEQIRRRDKVATP